MLKLLCFDYFSKTFVSITFDYYWHILLVLTISIMAKVVIKSFQGVVIRL